MDRYAMKVGFKKLHPDATIPEHGAKDIFNAGLDLCALHDLTIQPKMWAIMDTGVAWDGMALCTQYEQPVMIVKSRSGMAFNEGIEASNAGVVDASYQGPIKVKLYNMSEKPYSVKKGQRIAQGIVYMIPNVVACEIEDFSQNTDRGENGFGSTGT